MKKRIISVILASAMIMALLVPLAPTVFAAGESMSLTVSSVSGTSGETVQVTVRVSNNPGIASLIFDIEYDSALTLTNVEFGSAFRATASAAKPYTNPQPVKVISLMSDVRGNGILATLTFAIDENTENGHEADINITFSPDDIFNSSGAAVGLTVTNGKVSVYDGLPGDIDGNGKVNTKDVIELIRYISGLSANADPDALNVNGDNAVNALDATHLFKYVAGWDGIVLHRGGIKHVHSLTMTEAKPASCTESGNITYFHCPSCGKYYTDAAAKNEITLAETVTPASGHSMTATEAKEATCTEDGNNQYWECERCFKLYNDKNGTVEISLTDTVIEARGHLPGAEPTCSEAQTCTRCGAVLKVANNHTEIIIPGYAATTEKEGLTDGIKCLVCGEWVIKQIVIDKLIPKEHSITYIINAGDYIDQGDAYLQAQVIINPNDNVYSENEMVILQPLSTPGYTFDGWVDQSGARWDVIPKGSTQDLVLYAKWTQNVYTVTFDTPDVDVYTTYAGETLKNKAKYTIDTGLTLTNPKSYKYSFVGWSNNEGFIVNEIKPGTAQNITLRANWTSDRNRATSYSDYGEPIIIEDNERKQFLFVYNIGKIDNVPLYTYQRENGALIEYHNTTVDFVETTTLKTEFGREDAQNIAKTVANATTRSSGWTLSEGWNDVMSESQSDSNKQIKSEERVDSKGNKIGNAYFISNSEGGSSYSSVESGSSSSSSARVTTEDSFGINTSYDKSTEKYCDAELSTGFKNETEVSAGVSLPIKFVDVSAGVKNTTTITADAKLSSGRKDNEAFHADTNASSFVGTDFSSNTSSHYNAVTSNSTNWNSNNSYEKSSEMSQESTISEAIAKEIESTTTYNISKALSGAKENTESVSGMTSDETGYSNSVTVSEYFSRENVYVESHKDDTVGHHRLVEAGIVHVYGVVGYDIATASYYTYTFNVLEDDTYAYWDYSMKDPSFTDCENGLVTFEIPYEVNEYISGVTGQTEGIEIEINDEGYGCVKAFESVDGFNGDVVVPQYYGANNLDDTFDPVIVTSFSADAFRGNTEIKTVILPMYVTEIPDYAFEGCTNLETVIAYGVTKIGKNAFKGCENLGKYVNSKGETECSAFMIDNLVTELGEGAFEGASEIKVMAYDASVADAAINSGAKRITVDLTKLADDYSGTKKIISSTEYFKIIGGGKIFSGLKLDSDAQESFVSNITLADNMDIPLEFSSETVTLARVTVENAPGVALCLKSDNTNLKLYRTVVLTSNSGNSVLSKNIILSKANSSISGMLDFSGNYLVCGKITNTSMLKYPENVKTLTEDEYKKYLSTVTVTFDTDGGSDIASVTIGYDTKLVSPLAPSKDHHSFLGWYIDEALTTVFIFDTPITSDITLYAKWKLNELTVTFDANGGNSFITSKDVIYGEAYGDIPTPTRPGYAFNGWYTAINGGAKITADTTVTALTNHTLYAKWDIITYKVSWVDNSNDGYSVTVKRISSPNANASIGTLNNGATVYYGDALSVTYTKDDYWTINTNGATAITVTDNVTSASIYATATLNPILGWVKADSVPSGAQVVERKWTYRESTSNSASSLSGWINNGREITSWSATQGPVYFNPDNGVRKVWSEQYEVSRTHYYHYYRYRNSSGTQGSDTQWGNYTTYESVDLTYKLTDKGTFGSTQGYKWYYKGDGATYRTMWFEYEWDDIQYGTRWYYQDPIYTYYYYRDTESTSKPTGSNVSNLVEYVKYRAK